LRIAWVTVGAIVARVVADADAAAGDRLAGVRRIGIDEISYRRHQRYLLVVVDHDRRRLVYAVAGANMQTLHGFFDTLGPARTAALTHISADAAAFIRIVVAQRAPHAQLCADPFHVVAWAMDALDQVRRETWNQVRTRQRRGAHAVGPGRPVADARFALWKNPANLTQADRVRLAYIAATHPRLHRAWALKEGLRTVFTHRGPAAIDALNQWLGWASRSRIPAFVRLARRLRDYRDPIIATLTHDLTNALIESTNTKIRLITRRAYGFRNVNALIALTRLSLSGNRPHLPT
jgi:transposase